MISDFIPLLIANYDYRLHYGFSHCDVSTFGVLNFFLVFVNIWYRGARLVSEVTMSIHLRLHLSLMEYKVCFQDIICIIE